jgi:hypothetical protein
MLFSHLEYERASFLESVALGISCATCFVCCSSGTLREFSRTDMARNLGGHGRSSAFVPWSLVG